DLLLLRGARATVEDEIVAGVGAEALFDGGLAVTEDLGLELHRARLVDAVDVAEHGGEEVYAAVERTELLRDPNHVLGRGVHLGPVDTLVVRGVLDATHDADLQF